MSTIYQRVEKYYSEHPQATLEQVLEHLGKRQTPRVMATIVLVQTNIRGNYPDKRKNTNAHEKRGRKNLTLYT